MHNGVLTTQPKTSVALNRGSPLFRGLKFAGHRGAWLGDPANGVDWSTTGTITHGSTQYGQAFGTDGTASYLSKTGDPLNASNSRIFSFMCVVTPRGTLQLDRRIMALGLSTDTDTIIGFGTGAAVVTSVRLYVRDVAGTIINPVPDITGELQSGKTSILFLVASADGNIYLYSRTSVASSTATWTGAFTSDRVALGCLLRSTAGSFFQGDYSMWAGWDRELSLHEINMMRANPFQLFAAPSQSSMNLIRAAYVPSGGGANQILAGRRFSLAGASGLAG